VDDSDDSAETLCGSNSDVDQIISFDAQYLTLTFKSDQSVTKRGFKITYKIVSRKGLQYTISFFGHHCHHARTSLSERENHFCILKPTKKLCYRKGDRAMRLIYECPERF